MTPTERILRLSKDTPLSVTVGSLVGVVVILFSVMGIAYKAKNDIEAANARQDADIAALRDKVTDVKDTLNEIKADVKSLLRSKP